MLNDHLITVRPGEVSDCVARLNAICEDKENAHIEAEEAILEFLQDAGMKQIVDAWFSCKNRHGGFWYA